MSRGLLIDRLFEQSLPGLSKAMDLHMKRSEALVSNISNAETPGYRAVDVNFAGELERAFKHQKEELSQTNSKHIDLVENSGTAYLMADLSGATKPDGNNVDIDLQMARLSEASGKYSMAANLVRKKIQILRYAIQSAAV